MTKDRNAKAKTKGREIRYTFMSFQSVFHPFQDHHDPTDNQTDLMWDERCFGVPFLPSVTFAVGVPFLTL